MYNKAPVICSTTYINDMYALRDKLNKADYDCIIALKRSGFMLGAFLSNQFTLPLFTTSEVKSIPSKFTRILIVDDKICTGKSFNKIINKLPLLISITTACMYVQSTKYSNIYVSNVKEIHKMWYEID